MKRVQLFYECKLSSNKHDLQQRKFEQFFKTEPTTVSTIVQSGATTVSTIFQNEANSLNVFSKRSNINLNIFQNGKIKFFNIFSERSRSSRPRSEQRHSVDERHRVRARKSHRRSRRVWSSHPGLQTFSKEF
jgi:hypothetical protein